VVLLVAAFLSWESPQEPTLVNHGDVDLISLEMSRVGATTAVIGSDGVYLLMDADGALICSFDLAGGR
jgi:hypothetical protein